VLSTVTISHSAHSASENGGTAQIGVQLPRLSHAHYRITHHRTSQYTSTVYTYHLYCPSSLNTVYMASSAGKRVRKRTYKARGSFEDSAPLARPRPRLHPDLSREDSEEVDNHHLDEATHPLVYWPQPHCLHIPSPPSHARKTTPHAHGTVTPQ
jgi:hypothetical protein